MFIFTHGTKIHLKLWSRSSDVLESPVMMIIPSRYASCSRYRISYVFLGKVWIESVICSSWKYRMCDVSGSTLRHGCWKAVNVVIFLRNALWLLGIIFRMNHEERNIHSFVWETQIMIQKIIFAVWLWDYKNRENIKCSFYFTVAVLLYIISINFNIISMLCS